MKYIKTKRLILRDWQQSDTAPFIAMNQDPDVRRYFPEKLSTEASKQFIVDAQKDIEDRGFGLFAVERRDTGEFIGFTGIQVLEEDGPFRLEFLPCIEIGWRLMKKHWNQGFATEAAVGVLKFAERHTDIKEVYGLAAKRNWPSIHVMEKIGMARVEEFDHPLIMEGHSLRKHVVYKLEM
ncbi:GNAT family N-acetyltransferase [Salinicoccus roseus]|uniref:GNAT family N-acetyltransferase n=2 Tax=Salinicoccus roseus TaxID=45670 RepID=A0A265E6K7_9STAP|nr:GNAT family N-acetyltransferase [Salinicoccus roseus]MBY8910607.1 GNAT family N-acetyltransferase [Salinicoccus roseus]OZT77231.1 GNAT family N-acetyltransferase [Salinicoccus roseus]RPE55102.1 RimJ/RimL family protein N-acetyltransferase [Salinicoccus roseus]